LRERGTVEYGKKVTWIRGKGSTRLPRGKLKKRKGKRKISQTPGGADARFAQIAEDRDECQHKNELVDQKTRQKGEKNSGEGTLAPRKRLSSRQEHPE